MKCPTCSAHVADESLTACPSCGSSLEESEELFAPTRKLDNSDDLFAPTRKLSGPPKSPPPPRESTPPSRKVSTSRPSRTFSSIHDSSIDNARFVAGTMLAERYRIVGLLGRGGMGEVYRADDLKLEQPVALKFLPDSLSLDGAALARFHREVRVARQISHRNVCRIYDIGETEGLHYISMEHIKGEELSSALKRFGRLPQDKAVEIARQICAGLAAAHDAGVLHRDLKPANIMIDDMGQARIMDFGLAGLAEEFEGEHAIEGTPEYMSPEQFEGKELTVKSDVYSLGLVLYELFTGKKAFTANTLPELIRLRKTELMPESPSMFARDLNPLVERVIERCLAADPKDRPASALQVAAALPGGDPVQAALAAGETPSPEMVAASSTEGALKPAVAVALFVGFLLALAGSLFLSGKVLLQNRVPLEKSAEGLRERAGELVRKFGYADATDSAFGFSPNQEYINYIKRTDTSPARWDRLKNGQPAGMIFWYRQSPRYLEPFNRQGITTSDPPRVVAGMTGVTLDPRGRLILFYGVPPQLNEPRDPQLPPAPDWSAFFTEAGLDASKLTPSEPKWVPMHPFDVQVAWEGTYPDQPEMPIRVEAASFRGRAVYFTIIDPWDAPTRQRPQVENWQLKAVQVFLLFMLAVILLGAALLARRNLKLGRGDRRGAARIAGLAFALNMLSWLFGTHHVLSVLGEAALFFQGLAFCLMIAAMLWLVYVALEPSVRRRWPNMIVGWSRLMAGDLADPLVGRDILIGALIGVGLTLLGFIQSSLPSWLGMPESTPAAGATGAFQGARHYITLLSTQVVSSFLFPAALLFLLLLFSIILRRKWIAVGALWLALFLPAMLSGENKSIDWIFAAVNAALTLFLLLRFGLLAMVSAQFFAYMFFFFPVTPNFSAWYAGATYFICAIGVGLAAYGFYTSLAGQKLFKGDLVGD